MGNWKFAGNSLKVLLQLSILNSLKIINWYKYNPYRIWNLWTISWSRKSSRNCRSLSDISVKSFRSRNGSISLIRGFRGTTPRGSPLKNSINTITGLTIRRSPSWTMWRNYKMMTARGKSLSRSTRSWITGKTRSCRFTEEKMKESPYRVVVCKAYKNQIWVCWNRPSKGMGWMTHSEFPTIIISKQRT